MAQARLRIYYGGGEDVGESVIGNGGASLTSDATNQVTVSLREILPILSDALQNNRSWLKDF